MPGISLQHAATAAVRFEVRTLSTRFMLSSASSSSPRQTSPFFSSTVTMPPSASCRRMMGMPMPALPVTDTARTGVRVSPTSTDRHKTDKTANRQGRETKQTQPDTQKTGSKRRLVSWQEGRARKIHDEAEGDSTRTYCEKVHQIDMHITPVLYIAAMIRAHCHQASANCVPSQSEQRYGRGKARPGFTETK